MTTSLKPALHTPTSSKGVTKANPRSDASAQSVAAIALNMAWQLAVIVLVPIFAGHLLDIRLKSSPTWTIVGLVVSVAGMVIVIRQTLQALNQINGTNDSEHKS